MSRVTVFNPQVTQQIASIPGASRPAALQDVEVGFVDNSKQNADLFIERLQPLLRDQYGIKLGARVRKRAPKDELSLSDLADLANCTAVVQCFGD